MPTTAHAGRRVLVFADRGHGVAHLVDQLHRAGIEHDLVDPWTRGELAVDLGVRSLPTVVALHDGAVRARLTGPATRRRTSSFVREVVRTRRTEPATSALGPSPTPPAPPLVPAI